MAKKRLEDMTEPELAALMRAAANGITAAAESQGVEPPLFCLVLFNDPQVAQYIANCQRADVITAMRETADRLQRRQDVERVQFPPRAPANRMPNARPGTQPGDYRPGG